MTGKTAPAQPAAIVLNVVDENGDALDPSTLHALSRDLSHDETAELLRLARASGRVLERDGLSIYGLGVAARFVAPHGFGANDAAAFVSKHLNAISQQARNDDALPLVMGSLPFDNFAAGELVVPRVAVRIKPDRATLVCVGPRDELDAIVREPTSVVAAPVTQSAPPDHFELISVQSHEQFKELVATAVEAIAAGEFQKVVVAREVEVRANRAFAPNDLLARLRALYPSCATFSMGDFVGASPELLCRRTASLLRAHPLAGTIARSGDPEEDERLATSLLASAKDRSEHGFVVDAIVAALRAFTPNVTASPEPHLLELRNVVHLATTIEAQLSEPLPGALEVAIALHPTPAVGGFPEHAALDWLEKHETLDRDRYAGPLGYMDASGDGEWWLGIRSALLRGSSARLIAGVGIVADSEPAAELAETQLKLQALLAAAVRP